MSEITLPKGWALARYEDVYLSASNGIGGTQNKEGLGIPVSRIETIASENINYKRIGFLATYDKSKVEKYKLVKGEILFSHINSPIHLGKTAIYDGKHTLYHGINLLRIVVDPKIIFPEIFNWHCKYTRTQGEFSLRAQHAVNQSSINQKKLGAFEIALPPLTEQKVIADKLDTLLAQVETTKARLERIPEILKTLRQSVLAAAVSGELTKEWRENAQFKVISEELGKLAKFIDYRGKTPTKTVSGIPLITAKNIRQGFILREPREFIALENYDSWMTRGIPRYGDVLITTEAPMGYVANIDIEEKFALAQRAICLQFTEQINPYFASIYMQASEFQKALNENATGSTVKGIKAALLKKIQIQFPSMDEQTKIISQVEELFAFADRVEQKTNTALERVNNLTQSILVKAFCGELTTDWRVANLDLISGENSAEALLEKIKSERKAMKLKKKTNARKKA